MTEVELSKESLKVGDKVAIKASYIIGWNMYVCDNYDIVTIDSISPKRTKIMTGNKNIAKHHLYQVNDYITNISSTASKKIQLATAVYDSLINTQKKSDSLRNVLQKIRELSDDELSRHISVCNMYNNMISELIEEGQQK